MRMSDIYFYLSSLRIMSDSVKFYNVYKYLCRIMQVKEIWQPVNNIKEVHESLE